MGNTDKKTNLNKKDIQGLLEEAGLNSLYRAWSKRQDGGLLGRNRPGEIISREGYAEAEKALLDPQVSTCFLLNVFPLMKKNIKFIAIDEGKKRDINKSKEIAKFLNFSLKKIQNGGDKQLQFDMITGKFFGNSLIERVYDILQPSQSSKYSSFYYYRQCKAKRTGLWEFAYDKDDNVVGYFSLLNRAKIWSKNKFIHLAFLPTFNNPNGNGDFDRIWRFWDAKREFVIFLLTLGSRLAKGRQTILTGSNNGVYDQEEVDNILESLTENLASYIPEGYKVEFSNFDVGALQYFLQVLKWLDSQIAIAMIGNALSINEAQGSGTYAQSKVHQETGLTFEEYLEGLICDSMDEQYAPDLITLNFDSNLYPEEIWPHAVLECEVEESPLDKLTKYDKLKALGVIDLDTEIDLNFVRQQFPELPENPELFIKLEEDIAAENDPNNPDNMDNSGNDNSGTTKNNSDSNSNSQDNTDGKAEE